MRCGCLQEAARKAHELSFHHPKGWEGQLIWRDVNRSSSYTLEWFDDIRICFLEKIGGRTRALVHQLLFHTHLNRHPVSVEDSEERLFAVLSTSTHPLFHISIAFQPLSGWFISSIAFTATRASATSGLIHSGWLFTSIVACLSLRTLRSLR